MPFHGVFPVPTLYNTICMPPGGHCWDYRSATFASLWRHCNSYEDWLPIDDETFQCPISKSVAATWPIYTAAQFLWRYENLWQLDFNRIHETLWHENVLVFTGSLERNKWSPMGCLKKESNAELCVFVIWTNCSTNSRVVCNSRHTTVKDCMC